MDDWTKGYLSGIEDGYKLGSVAEQARGNVTAAQYYNDQVKLFNLWLENRTNSSESNMTALGEIPMPVEMPELPRVFNDSDDSWYRGEA